MLEVFVLRWCRLGHAGAVFVLRGARRRWSFLREGPNGSAVHVEVVTVAWDPCPGEPVEGVLRATSVLELEAQQADSGAEGKTVVRLLSSGRARVGRTRRGGSGGPRSWQWFPFLVYVTLSVCP
ncbi:hypothetical protein Taro_039223 [Colocasia esculenta]|uniref:Uncharacterized protein n=1 Tax=Colocasia esculenta TaxID=4460 RepID=A0A843WG15_COLES|nr:hypothetical protein [Colocasia esculenta]